MRNILLSFCVFLLLQSGALAQAGAVQSIKVKDLPFHEVTNPVWKNIAATAIAVMPQNIALPNLHSASIQGLRVRSVHNEDWIAFLLEWDDPTRDAALDIKQFSDQIAIQFPVDPSILPAFMMGNKGGRVHIIHWKAIWQDDIEKGYQDVQNLHPNYWVDLYYFAETPVHAEGEFPSQMQAVTFKKPEAVNYMPGAYSRNPVTIMARTEPVEEGMAEGFGTFTTQPKQNARGWGQWEKGIWRVIIARPLISDDSNDGAISEKTHVSFAIWNGSEHNVGARKHYAPWTEVVLEK